MQAQHKIPRAGIHRRYYCLFLVWTPNEKPSLNVLIHCCLLPIWIKNLWACKKWLRCAFAPLKAQLSHGLLKESLIFVFFRFSFLNWSKSPKSHQTPFLVKSDCQDSLSRVRKKAVNLNIPNVNTKLIPVFSVWYSYSYSLMFPLHWLCVLP